MSGVCFVDVLLVYPFVLCVAESEQLNTAQMDVCIVDVLLYPFVLCVAESGQLHTAQKDFMFC
jgi:hypothetical protein